MTTRRIDHSQDGTRVEISPATDDWMRGDRYGEIIRMTHYTANKLDPRESAWAVVAVKLDKSGRTRRYNAAYIRVI